MLLTPGDTCWRRDRAGRGAVLIDTADYFEAAMSAMKRARRSIHFLNWAFDPQTLFHPKPGRAGEDTDRIGAFLKAITAENPQLDVRVLCWKSALPVAATQNLFPLNGRKAFAGSEVKFVLDGRLPGGACHHQKVIIIDDNLAFAGGADIGPDRWDTCEHLDDDPRRLKTGRGGGCFDSRHEVMAVVDGAVARSLGDLFRERWLRATGEHLPPPAHRLDPAWPTGVAVGFEGVAAGISRTQALWRDYPSIREAEALHLAAIRDASRCIYMENQYFTSPVIAAALAARLEQTDGPEVVLISAECSPSYFDRLTMDRTRSNFIRRLRAADKHDRFRAYSAVTSLGRPMIVHAKLTIIDDRLLRIGSANLNNRSLGFDTECDLTFEAAGRGAFEHRREINRLRTRLIAHWLGCDDALVEMSIAGEGGLGPALEALRCNGHTRLRPTQAAPLKGLAALVAEYHLGDPVGVDDAWRPWRRRRVLGRRLQNLAKADLSLGAMSTADT